MSELLLSDLAKILGARLQGDGQRLIRGVATIDAAGPDEVTFLSNLAYAPRLKECKAAAVLVSDSYEGEIPMTALRTPHPRIAFGRAIAHFHPRPLPPPGIHPTAVIAPTASLGANVHVGPYVTIGAKCSVGEGSVLHAHCVLYPDVVIGRNCQIHSHVSIREGTRIGDRVELHNGCVIGSDGFGFEPDEKGELHKIPQMGIVRIEDDVEIQANSCVDRASVGETRIGRGTKMDNLVQVGHSCTIGEHNIICAQVAVGGSTKLGKRVQIGGQAGITGHLTVGDDTEIAGKAGVHADLKGGASWGGVPVVELGLWRREVFALARLPEALRALKALTRRVDELSPPPPPSAAK